MNQAQEIRSTAIELLKYNKEYLEDIDIDANIKGIRYSNLKKILLESKKFTSGAIVGAIGTLEKKVINIHKVKTSKGVFFYYATNEDLRGVTVYSIIIESMDYKDLTVQISNISKKIREILKSSSDENYLSVSDIDIKYLRILLGQSYELEQTLKNYENERILEMVQDKRNSYSEKFPF